MKSDQVRQEMEAIAAQHPEGKLVPRAVVDFARDNPESELHRHFEWDDGAAAEKYRLTQARALIRVVVIVPEPYPHKVRAFVSLPEDRQEGGYRAVKSVLNDTERRAQLLRGALADLNTWRRKYAVLQELAQVFEAADAVLEDQTDRAAS